MNVFAKVIKPIPPRYVQGLIIYFVAGTVVGWYIELIWLSLQNSPSYFITRIQALPFAEPYGFGAVAIILFVLPVMRRYRLGVFGVYILNVLVTTITEFICAAVLILMFGRNTFWDYSGQPYNLYGYVCLQSSVLFGVIAVLFVYFGYPACERLLARLTLRRLTVAAISLGVAYIVVLFVFKRW